VRAKDVRVRVGGGQQSTNGQKGFFGGNGKSEPIKVDTGSNPSARKTWVLGGGTDGFTKPTTNTKKYRPNRNTQKSKRMVAG